MHAVSVYLCVPSLIWMFPKIGFFPPKSSILIGFSIIFTIHFGVSLFLEDHFLSKWVICRFQPLIFQDSWEGGWDTGFSCWTVGREAGLGFGILGLRV